MTESLLHRVADTCSSDAPVDVRDRALLLLQFAGAFRRSELAERVWADVEFDEHEVRVFLARSKTDQFSEGQTVRVALSPGGQYCPGAALRAWQKCLERLTGRAAEGPLFRSLKERGYLSPLRDQVIAEIVKDRAEQAGLEGDFSGHSARRGYITSQVRAGTPNDQIQAVTRHKSGAMIASYTEATRKIGPSLL